MALFNPLGPVADEQPTPDLLAQMGGSAPVTPSAGGDMMSQGNIPVAEAQPLPITAAPTKVPAANTPSDTSAASVPTVEPESPTKQMLRKLAMVGLFLAPPFGAAGLAMLGKTPEAKAREQMAMQGTAARNALISAQAGSYTAPPSDLDVARTNVLNLQKQLTQLQIDQMRDPKNQELERRSKEAKIKLDEAKAIQDRATAQHQLRLGATTQRMESAVAKMFDDVVSKRRDLTKQPWDLNEKAIFGMYGLLKQAGQTQQPGAIPLNMLDEMDKFLTGMGIPKAKGETAAPAAATTQELPDALKGVEGSKGRDRYKKGGDTWDWNYTTKKWERK